jgi:hypothetical protein
MLRLQVTADVVPRTMIFVALMMRAARRSSETSVLTKATGLNIPEAVFLIYKRD